MTTLNHSFLALGSIVAGGGLLAAGLLALLFRNPRAPRWTRPEVVAMLLCVPLAATIGFGFGYVIYGLHQLAHGAEDAHGLLVLASVLLGLPLLWRALRIRQRLKAYAFASGGCAPDTPPATASGPPGGLPGAPA